jgi:hypothetical protein
MGRIGNTIQLAKASWEVLKADRELVLLPLMSGIASFVVVVLFIAPIFLSLRAEGAAEAQFGILEFVLFFLLYVVLAFITIYFNAALIYAADDRMRGIDPSLRSALRSATEKAGAILPWAIISATVSVVLRSLQERAGIIGRIVIGLVGVAWSLVTFLVLPIIVLEDLGAVAAIKRSTFLFKRTWGENVVAQAGFGILGAVLSLPAVGVVFLGFTLGTVGVIVGLVIAFLWVVTVSIVISALSGIYQTALYHYASDGEIPGGAFPEQAVAAAFAPKGAARALNFGGW